MSYPAYRSPPVPSAFIWRRTQSFMGLWLVFFLIEHLLVNSQAALFMGEDGSGFVAAVNSIKGLPYLTVIEIFLLGVPFLIHGIWGIRYALTADYNSFPTNGSSPALPQYSRNQAFTWQRITSWILLFGILAHVIHMRFLEYPGSAQLGSEHFYFVRLNQDNGLYPLSKRLGFDIYNAQQVQEFHDEMLSRPWTFEAQGDNPQELIEAQTNRQRLSWLNALESYPLQENQVIASSSSFGVAELLMVRDTFKNPWMILLYTGFVLSACFHAFNGLWTFMIKWGVTLTANAQRLMRILSTFLMVLISFLGLAAIWGTYWLNLKS